MTWWNWALIGWAVLATAGAIALGVALSLRIDPAAELLPRHDDLFAFVGADRATTHSRTGQQAAAGPQVPVQPGPPAIELGGSASGSAA